MLYKKTKMMLPESSARAAITCLGSVLLLGESSLPPTIRLLSVLSTEQENLLKGLYGSWGPIRRVTGILPARLPTFSLFLLVSFGRIFFFRLTIGTPRLEYRGELT